MGLLLASLNYINDKFKLAERGFTELKTRGEELYGESDI